jgi:hypothetical protein
MPTGEAAGLARDARDQIGVEQEMLAKRAPRVQPMPRDDLAQPGRLIQGQERLSVIARRCRSRSNWREASSMR